MSTPFPQDVGVAVVCHDNLDKLPATLASIDATGCPHDRLLVVDVLSTDGTVEWLRKTYPAVRVLTLDRNDGPSPGRNVAIRETAQPYVFLMDADVQVGPETIQRLRAAMADDPAIKIGSPIVVHVSDPAVIQYAEGSLHFICEAINPWMDRPLAERGSAPADIGVAPTCGLLLDRAAAIDVGLFDERYFIGKEDGDFTHRIRLAGYRILELPDALVLHHSRPRGNWLFYYQIRNRWHFMLKNYQWRTLIAILPVLAIHEPLQLVVLHAKGHGRVYWKAVGGLLAMLPDLRRDRALVTRIRKVPDTALLRSDRLIVREDLMTPLARRGKAAYERMLAMYWSVLRATVLAG
ncbi:MAG TPA: glycosyltransferase [Vicinamibacterales bacterium]|nr:glycosyltransferase [Vicinamibacterales bacterium]